MPPEGPQGPGNGDRPTSPRLNRPRAFREARDADRRRQEWDALSEAERETRLRSIWSAEADERYLKARAKMLALLDSGAAAAFLVEVTGFMSKRGLRLLKKAAALPGRDGRQARWILLECIRLGARMEAEQPLALGPAIKVKTRFATDGEKVQGRFEPDGGPRVNVRATYQRPEPPPDARDEEE